MILVIGGAGAGKRGYVLSHGGFAPEQVAYDPETARTRPVFDGLAAWVRAHGEEDVAGALDGLLTANPGVVILCDEVGCGVVPVDPGERAWREAVGRLCCALAGRADCVLRLFCGLPMVLKGESPWN